MTTITIPDAEPLTMNWNPDAIMFLIYGASGTYKTPAVAQWPRPIIYIDTDNGMLSILSVFTDFTDIYRVEIKDRQESPSGYAGPIGWMTVISVLKSIAETGCYGVRNKIFPKTVVLDTLSTASKYAMSHVLFKQNHVNNPQPTQQDWGLQMSELDKALNYGISLPCHFVCVAHEQLAKEEVTGRGWIVPLVTGKMAFNIDNRFSEVYHSKPTQAGADIKYQFETRGTPLIRAKSRMGVPPLITSFTDIKTRIAELNLKTSGAQQGQKGGTPTQQTVQQPSATQQSGQTWGKQP